jgi:gamma-glutamyltranspeptidase/glutathione hydrolase
MADDGIVRVFDGVGRWPAATDRLCFENDFRGRIPLGILRTVVPAAPSAWVSALALLGTKGFAELAAPAHQLAVEGFEAHDDLVQASSQYAKYYRRFPANAEIWMPDGKPIAHGQIVRNLALASVLTRMIDADRGAASASGRIAGLEAVFDLFYRGSIADQMIEHVKAHGGWLDKTDLAAHRTRIDLATQAPVFGGTLFTCGPWSQGPALSQALMIAESYGRLHGSNDEAEQLHAMIEAINSAIADREAFYGDPDFTDVPMAELLSVNYAMTRAGMIDPRKALGRLPSPGLTGEGTRVSEHKTDVAHPVLDTSVVSVVDRFGNVFAATPSDASIDGPVVPELGFVISTRGAQSHTEKDHPASVAPNKRPRITACPILFEDGCGGILAGGGPGGDMQLQAMAQVLCRHLGRGEPLHNAVAAPRVYTQSGPSSSSPHVSFPGRVSAEDGIPQDVVAALEGRGHHIVAASPAGINRASVCLVSSGPAKSDLLAVGDPRRGSGQRVGTMAGRQP